MSNTLRNILVTIGGWIVGSIVNTIIVLLGPSLIPPPDGAILNTMEGLAEAMPKMGAEHFIMPFLSHAIGTLVGAFFVARLAASAHFWCVLVIALLFFAGGLYMALQLPAPLWFELTDLIGAYFPMGVLGYLLGRKKKIDESETIH